MVCYLSLQVLGKFICHMVETTASPNGIAPVGSWWSWDAKVINWCCNPCGYWMVVQNELEFMKFLTNPLAIWFVYSVYMHVVDFFASYSSELKFSVARSMAGMIWQRSYGARHQLPEQSRASSWSWLLGHWASSPLPLAVFGDGPPKKERKLH